MKITQFYIGKKDYSIKIIIILFYFLIFCFILNNSFSYLDNDLGWHLKVGEEIWKNKIISPIEHYDYTIEGIEWVDFEWLSNMICYGIFNYFGYIALSIFFAAIIIIVLLLQLYFLQKNRSNNNGARSNLFFIFLFQFLGVTAFAPNIGIRIQELALLNVLLLLEILFIYENKNNKKILWWLLPLFFVWANMHGSFFIGIFLLSFFLFYKLLSIALNRIYKYKKIEKNQLKNFLELSAFFFFSFLVTLLNPYGIKIYTFFFTYANDFYTHVIAEWLPFYYLPILYIPLIFIAIVTAMILISIISAICNKQSFKNFIFDNLWDLLLISMFCFLALKSKRHFPIFYIVSFPLLLKLTINNFAPTDYLKKLFSKSWIIKINLVVAIILLSFSFLAGTKFTNDPFNNKYYCNFFPCQSIRFLKDNGYEKYKIFNYYDWGGYMIWAWPEKKLFIDGRIPQVKFKNHTLLEEYIEFFKKDQSIKKLDEYEIDLVMLKEKPKIKLKKWEKFFLGLKEEQLNNTKYYLKESLDNDKNWKLIYNDNISYIYLRN